MASKNIVDKALLALRKKEKGVQLRGNTLIGFSEGAFIAMNIGVREPRVFSRWLILAASDAYWGGEGQTELEKNGRRLRRVYLMTGQQDSALGATERVFHILDDAGVHVMLRTPDDLGHEIPGEQMRLVYRRPLQWLSQ
jgi:predicted esterase